MSGSTPDFDPTLERLASLPDDHPDVTALRRDPARWAQLLALREFLAPGALPEGARPDAARSRLRAAVRGALSEQAELPAPTVAAPREIRLAPHTPWWRQRWGVVPAWAAAAAGVLLVAALGLPRMAREPARYRGTASEAVTLIGATQVSGGIELRWRATLGADRYVVSVRDASLQALVSPVTTSDTVLVLPLTGRLAERAEGDVALWSVVAMRGSTRIAASRDLPLP